MCDPRRAGESPVASRGRDDLRRGGSHPDAARPKPACRALFVLSAATVLRAFLDAFPQRSTVTTICNQDLSDALTVIAELLREVIGSPCLDGKIIQDPLDCVVTESDAGGEQRLPECNSADGNAATNQPCWLIAPDSAQCPDTPTGLSITVFPEERSLPSGAIREINCLAEA